MGRILDKYYPATVCYYIWTATYAGKSAYTNIDGNDGYVTNTDENTSTIQYEVTNIYLY